MLTFRPVCVEEIESVDEFCARAFGHDVRNRYVSDLPPGAADSFHHILLDGDATVGQEIVAHGCFYPKPVRIHGCLTRVGDVANICTHPARRGEGFGATLMRGLVDVMRTARIPLSLLGGPPDFYRKFGWEATGGTVEIDVGGAPESEPPPVKPIAHSDLHWIAPLYERVWGGRTGMIQRDERWWRAWLERVSTACSFTLPDQSGYAVARGPHNGKMLITEISASNEPSFHRLCDAILWAGAQRGAHGLEFHCHRDEQEYLQFRRWAESRELTIQRETCFSGSVWRVVDLAQLLLDLSPALRKRVDRPISICVDTGESRTSFHLSPDSLCLTEDATITLNMPVTKLCQWLLGPFTLREFIENGEVSLVGKVEVETLDRLFPPTGIYTAITDRD